MDAMQTKPCLPIALTAVTEIAMRHQRELLEAVKQAASASGIPDGEPWQLDIKAGVWVKDEPTPADE